MTVSSDSLDVLPCTERRLWQGTRNLRVLLKNHRILAYPPSEMMKAVAGVEIDETAFSFHGLLNVYNIMTFCGLRPHYSVLEPGCGCGRNARYIATLLDPRLGSFHGFDVSESMIRWCKDHISTVYPNVQFDHADVCNSLYNPEGSIRGDEYQFPYRNDKFDIVYLPSVFTHMTRTEFEHYLAEIHRVLKPNGRLLSWHFLLDAD